MLKTIAWNLWLGLVAACAVSMSAAAQNVVLLSPDQCRPEVLRKPSVVGMAVKGELSGFDPCHPSVTLTLPKGAEKPPLVISVHGGGGRSDAQAITNEFVANGMATLIFDAYKHNGVPPRTGNAYRQMMIYKVALQAYQWAVGRQDINTRQIYFYGISNGASVVLNLAAVVDPAHVKGVFSEAPTPVGIGYPWAIQVPVMIAFGQQDDLGARIGQKRWMISEPCRYAVYYAEASSGTTEQCSESRPNGQMLTTLEWAEKVAFKSGANLAVKYFEGVAHGAFLGPLTVQTEQQFAAKVGRIGSAEMGWSEGATLEGRQLLLTEALQFFTENTSPR